MKGHGSRIYGPNAFGGVINIVTQKPEKRELAFNTAAGENGLLMGSITYSHPINDDVHQITISEKQSDGYIPNSEFKLSSLAYNTSINSLGAVFDVSLGWQDKEFGANTFYTDRFPNEWEHITVGFLNAGASWAGNSFSYKNSISLRTHEDDFVLDSERPDWVRNSHSTDVLSIESQIDYDSNLGITSFGGEFGMESIKSPSLGDHDRNRGGSFFEHQFNDFGRLNIIAGAIAYCYEGWDWGVYPGVALGFTISQKLRLFGTVGGSFRVPTYTDLYYDTPANKGNPELQPEEATSFETGVVMTGGGYRTNISYFMRYGRDIIDWVRADPGDPWQVKNIPELNTSGIETSILIHPRWYNQVLPINHIRLGYTFIESDRKLEEFESKYALNYLEHQAKLSLRHPLPFGLMQTWEVRYEERIENAGYTVTDTRIAMKLSSGSVYVSATNLFDTSYREISSVVMPRRWIKVGWNLNLLGGV